MRSLSTATREWPLLASTRESPMCAPMKTQCSQEEGKNKRVQGSWQVESGERWSLAYRILDRIKELEKNSVTKQGKWKMQLETSESYVKKLLGWPKSSFRVFWKTYYVLNEVNLEIILCFTVNSSYQARRTNPCSRLGHDWSDLAAAAAKWFISLAQCTAKILKETITNVFIPH